MFATPIRCAVSPYAAFLRSGVHSHVADLPFAQRGAKLGQLYRALTPKQKKDLSAAASKQHYIRTAAYLKEQEALKAKETFVRPCLLTDYQLFVREQFRKGEEGQSLSKVAALWRNRDRKA